MLILCPVPSLFFGTSLPPGEKYVFVVVFCNLAQDSFFLSFFFWNSNGMYSNDVIDCDVTISFGYDVMNSFFVRISKFRPRLGVLNPIPGRLFIPLFLAGVGKFAHPT